MSETLPADPHQPVEEPEMVAGGRQRVPILGRQVLEALGEDPINTAALARRLEAASGDAESVLEVLLGLTPGSGVAARMLEEALARSHGSGGHAPMPLRLVLLESLMRHNLQAADPRPVEIHAAAVPAADHPADPVQGATSMAAINGALQTELRRARRFKQCCVTMRLGLDGWHDLVADRGRHAAGRLLSDLALVVKNEIRDVDWVARTPDHDLIIFLADTGRIGALQAAHRIRDKAMSHVAGKPDGPCGFALSLGLAGYPEDARFAAELLQRAGRALLRARALGWGVADRGLPEERRFLMVPPEAVRVVVRVLDTAESPPAGEEGTSGLLFTSPVPYAVGTSLELSCLESTGARRMQTRGRVVRLEQRPAGKGYHVGVMCDLPAGTDVLSRGDSADRVGD